MVEITNIKISINKDKVLLRLGYALGTNLTDEVDSLIDKQIDTAYSLIEPYAVYQDLEIESVKRDEVILKSAFVIKSRALAGILSNATKSTLIAVTIGSDIEKPTGDLTIDTIRDAIGSEAVESLAIKINELITKRAAAEGYKTLFRFSVGYGGWDIKDQRKILALLNPKQIILGKGYIMYPKKSITALIGWEKKIE